MTSMDAMPRPASHNGMPTVSPAESPRAMQRPASQASLHLPPAGYTHGNDQPQIMTAFPGAHPQPPYRPYQPSLTLPLSTNPSFYTSYPPSAPPLNFDGSSPIYDNRVSSVPMMRTISHAHGLHSATEHTASSRYSNSPHSAQFERGVPPPTATAPSAYTLQPPPGHVHMGAPGYGDMVDRRHMEATMMATADYNMSRSVSGGSGSSTDVDANGRLVTPHYEPRTGAPHFVSTEHELRKVSDNLGRSISGGGNGMMASGPYAAFGQRFPQYYQGHDVVHTAPLGAHPQPGMVFYGRGGYQPPPDQLHMSAERGDVKPPSGHDGFHDADNDYERERQKNIMDNRQLMAEMGLNSARMRSASHAGKRAVSKKRPHESPMRTSKRLASTSRAVSYADADGNQSVTESEGEDEYSSPELDDDDDDDFRPAKKTKGGRKTQGRQPSYAKKQQTRNTGGPKPNLSLYGLLETYDQIPHLYPLFYYTLNNDLTINGDSVPLIGSIHSTCTPIEKADTLQAYFHRGRRVLAQLDAFTTRCDRKYEGPEERWPELSYHFRIAVRDVRRKIVERCENYKYTRRDILDKILGKNKWQPIEHGMIEWRSSSLHNDPAGDLANVTLTLPTPPPGYAGTTQPSYPPRVVRPMPSRANLGSGNRVMSVTMGEPGEYAAGPAPMYGGYPGSAGPFRAPPHEMPPPMYGEEDVPMSVNMPPPMSAGPVTTSSQVATAGLATATGSASVRTPATAATSAGDAHAAPVWDGEQQAATRKGEAGAGWAGDFKA